MYTWQCGFFLMFVHEKGSQTKACEGIIDFVFLAS